MKNCYEIENAMSKLADEYREAVWVDIRENVGGDVKRLANIAACNRSSWSGGPSVKNLCEKITREVALKELEHALL